MFHEDVILSSYQGDFPLRIRCFSSLPSTNTHLIELAKQGEEEGLVLIADHQTQGRGRRGRSFFSPNGTGLYLSLLLRPKRSIDASLLITTTAAVSLCEAIEETVGLFPQIKWVNDILLHGKKVAGILTEGALAPLDQTLSYAVLGLGVNLFPPTEGFAKELSSIATVLSPTEDPALRDRLASSFLTHFFNHYRKSDDQTLYEAYRNRLQTRNQRVWVHGADGIKEAVALDLDQRYRLLVTYPDGNNEWLSSGEVSVRPTNE